MINSAIFPLPTLKVVSDDISKRDFRDAFGQDMALFHNTVIRGVNSIYAHATLIDEQRLEDFLFFIKAWSKVLSLHHKGEETIIFPELKGFIDVESSIDQHQAIHDCMHSVDEFVDSIKGWSSYDGQKLQSILARYAPAVHEHLTDEISTLDFGKLKAHIEEEKLKKIVHEDIQWVLETATPVVSLPLVIGCHDKGTNVFWPLLPPPVLEALPGIKIVHKGAWDFCPFDCVTGLPQLVVEPQNGRHA